MYTSHHINQTNSHSDYSQWTYLTFLFVVLIYIIAVSVSAMLVYTRQKNIAQVFILERYFFVSIYPAAIPGTYLAMFLEAVLQLC